MTNMNPEFKKIESFRVNGEFKKETELLYLKSIGAIILSEYLGNKWHMKVLDPVKYQNGCTFVDDYVKYCFGRKKNGLSYPQPTIADTF